MHSKTTLDSHKKLQLGVDIITELAECHQLAHARTPVMKRELSCWIGIDWFKRIIKSENHLQKAQIHPSWANEIQASCFDSVEKHELSV